MLPRLTAEESLLEGQRVMVGTGAAKQHQLRSVVSRWARDVNGGLREKAIPATPANLAAMGIRVRKVTRG